MNTYEIWSVSISVAGLIVTISGLLYAGYQIKLTRKQLNNAVETIQLTREIHKDNHEWNRREKSIQYSGLYHTRVKEARLLLDGHFNLFTRKDPIPLNELTEKMEKDKSIRSEINYLLTYYENMSIACKMGVADESIIKIMLKGAFVKYKMKLLNYINDRRDQTKNERLWINFTEYADKWASENKDRVQKREFTG